MERWISLRKTSRFKEIDMARKTKKRRYSRSAGNDVENEMRRYKKGKKVPKEK